MDAAEFANRLAGLKIDRSEVEELFARSSGPGGQGVNKVSTAVTLRWGEHSVTCQDSRSQGRNRALARERLIGAIEDARAAAAAARRQERERERRRRAPRPAGVKRRMVEGKRRRAQAKQLRRRPGSE
jgi:protein subunit release factor B